MKTALIVVDCQLDFCPGGRLAVAGGDEIMAQVNALMPEFDAVVLTQDWHPADHTSFADNHPGAAPYSTVTMDYGPQVLWPRHCVIGTKGAAFHPALNPDCAGVVIRKGFRRQIDSYSAFFENDKTTATGLAGYLRDRQIGRLCFVGLAYDFCVAWSAIDAVRLGFEASVIRSATRAIDLDGSARAATEAMREQGVNVQE
ncbi:MAG: bifunctional nicotinamidase/pyrazinamidase [Paracoccus sp. (in: a-proteobacteria)]|nr:bifunctional nicotinamidase/pyrazinamidase [Paracoccus sp. (in: a-proteobacteria)]